MVQSSTIPGHGASQFTNANSYGYGTSQGQYPAGQLYAAPNSNMHYTSASASIDSLTNAFGEVNLGNQGSVGSGKPSSNTLHPNIVGMSAMAGAQNNGQLMYQFADGSCVFSGAPAAQGNYQQYPGNYNMIPMQASHPHQAAYSPFATSGPYNLPNTPHGQTWMPLQHIPQEVPELTAPRRTSWSSNDGSSPLTPSFSGPTNNDVQRQYHSPLSVLWSTPSPKQITHAYSGPQIMKHRITKEYYFEDFHALTQRNPAIPTAIPAVYSPEGGRGTLDKILNNTESTTNVYIRGFPPNTTDDMIRAYGQRFGDIDKCKSMIEHTTGDCKGFGFIMYFNFVDAENCIRAFYYLGYEAKYARPSHNSRLKTLSDPNNNNLYVSNLPMTMTDPELLAIFTSVYPELKTKGHTVLKDGIGASRGVGFIRFETPEICENIIQEFHGKQIGEGKHSSILQIRFADTKDQKALKTSTTERRQFKATEYSHGVRACGFLPPYPFTSPNTATFPSPLQSRVLCSDGGLMGQIPISPKPSDYSPYQQMLRRNEAQIITAARPLSETNVASLPPRRSASVKIESPSVTAATKRAKENASAVSEAHQSTDSSGESDDDVPFSKSVPVYSCGGEADLSPTKSKL